MLAIVCRYCLKKMFSIVLVLCIINFETFPCLLIMVVDGLTGLLTPRSETSADKVTKFGDMMHD